MRTRWYLFMLASILLPVGIASAQQPQYPIMEKVVQKVIQKYQTSSCQQLAMQKSQPPTGQKAACPQRPWAIASKLFCRRRSSGNLCDCSSLHHDPHPCLGY